MMSSHSGTGLCGHFHLKQAERWTPQQWEEKLDEAKITAHAMIKEIEAVLERGEIQRARCWVAICQCWGLLRTLHLVMGTASMFTGWRLNPRILIERLTQEIQMINAIDTEPFLLQLALLDNDLEKLIVYSLS
jgi:hypothetical protein